jgi:hypothetical protein
MESALPTFILEIIRNEFQNCYTPNLDLLSYQDKKAQQQLLETMQNKSIAIGEMDMREEPVPMIEDGLMEERAEFEPDMEVTESPREILNERYVNEDIGAMAMQTTPRNLLGR